MNGGLRMTDWKRGEKGSAVYNFLGYLIIILVIIGALLYFPWDEVGGPGEDKTFDKAVSALEKGQFDKAVDLFGKVIEKDAKSVEAFIGRSRAYLNMGELSKAYEDAEQAVKLNAKKATALGQKAIVEKLQKKYDEAIADLQKALQVSPGYAWAHAQLADLYLRKNEPEKALESVNEALKVKPKFVEALRLRARILTEMGKCNEAYADFQKAAELLPENALTLQDKAWFLMTCPDEGARDVNKAMELAQEAYDLSGGKSGLVIETLAEAHFRHGEPLKAAELQEQAIELQLEKCPDGSCVEKMKERLQKYKLAGREEVRTDYEILPLDSSSK